MPRTLSLDVKCKLGTLRSHFYKIAGPLATSCRLNHTIDRSKSEEGECVARVPTVDRDDRGSRGECPQLRIEALTITRHTAAT